MEDENKTQDDNYIKLAEQSIEFVYINASDVARHIGKLYQGTKKTDKKNSAKYISSFIYLLTYIKDWKSEYSNKYIAACCGLKYTPQVCYYRKRHFDFMDNVRYRLRIKLALELLIKLENRKKSRFKQFNGIFNEQD